MKYLITENRFEKTIEDTLKKNFPSVVAVSFEKYKVYLAAEGITKDRTRINVVEDPYKVFEGNIPSLGDELLRLDLKYDIWNFLMDFFGLDFSSYGSDWDLAVYKVTVEKI